ncbi:MAG: hypothetical protein QOD26_1968 [Betaproteobacteria bacterium]|jgi:hypothetical protein|nr:hypothetical protein [Betaproteobacteria bacterium]
MKAAPDISAEINSLVTMLMAACEDAGMNETLDMLLSQPDDQRQYVVRELVQRMRASKAPQALIEAFLPLLDDAMAEKAYEVIFQCRRR